MFTTSSSLAFVHFKEIFDFLLSRFNNIGLLVDLDIGFY
jgi:hypothetical protein